MKKIFKKIAGNNIWQNPLLRNTLIMSLALATVLPVYDVDLKGLKVFSKPGEVLYSTNISDLGHVNNRKYLKEVIALGKVHSKFIHRDAESLEYACIRYEESFGVFLHFQLTCKEQ